MVTPVSANSDSQIRNQSISTFDNTISNIGNTTSRPPLGDILNNYQVKDDSIINYNPTFLGMIDIPFTSSVRMTKTEGDLLDNLTFSQGLLGLSSFKGLATSAFTESVTRYPNPTSYPSQAGTTPAEQNRFAQNDGHRDAFRHALWSANMTSEYGVNFAKQFATAHEGVPGNNATREAMDLYNNEVGRNIALANPSATRNEMATLVQQAVTDGKMLVIDSGGNLQWSNLVAYGQHGVGNSSPGPGQLPTPNGNAYPN